MADQSAAFHQCADLAQIVKITPRRKLAQIGADMVTVAPAAFGGDLEAAEYSRDFRAQTQ